MSNSLTRDKYLFFLKIPIRGGLNHELLVDLPHNPRPTFQEKDWHLEQRFEHRGYKSLLEFVDADPETSCPEGLVLVPDTRLFNDSAWNASAIPKIIHVTAKSRCMTTSFKDNLDKWRLPGYSLLVHNDAAVNSFLEQYWPEFPEIPKLYIVCCREQERLICGEH